MSLENAVHVPLIEAYQIRLRAIEENDLPLIRAWRNSNFVREKMVSTELISTEQQQAWYQKICRDASQLHWLIEYREQPIGSTNIKVPVVGATVKESRQLEPGLYIGEPAYQGNLVAFAPTLALYDYCFAHFAVQTFDAAVKPENTAALKYNQQLGYEIISQGDFVRLRLQKEAYERQTVTIRSILSRPRKS